jgi:alkylated DNA repair dioxygenase AlkB
MADKIMCQVQQEHPDVAHVMTQHSGYDCKDVNIYHARGSKGRHSDAQPYGRLNLVFSAGLSARASAWLGAQGVDYRTGETGGGSGGQQVTMEIESGDVWVMEGKTPHAIHKCIAGTSPTELGEWLSDQRASVLIRQRD